MKIPVKKIDKIAKNILGFDTCLNCTLDGMATSIAIDEIVIIITNEPLSSDLSRYASKARSTRWSLQEIKQLITILPPRIEYLPRLDGKSNPNNIGISESEAISIISNLDDSNFIEIKSDPRNSLLNADVYKVLQYHRLSGGEPIDIYIKFRIFEKKQRKVLLISFHQDE